MPTTNSSSSEKKITQKGVPESVPVDKDYLYGRYQAAQDARTKLEQDRAKWMYQFQRQTAHKAVDEPIEDGMGDFNQNVSKTQTGMGWRELAVIAALMGGTAATTAYVASNKEAEPPVTQPATPVTDSDTVIVPKIRFGPLPE
jgi:hypothetical protein